MSTPTIKFEELTPEQRQQLGLRSPRQSRFSAEQVRSWALRVLAEMAALSRSERHRVLKHAEKINRV
jgi:hypothetical protein